MLLIIPGPIIPGPIIPGPIGHRCAPQHPFHVFSSGGLVCCAPAGWPKMAAVKMASAVVIEWNLTIAFLHRTPTGLQRMEPDRNAIRGAGGCEFEDGLGSRVVQALSAMEVSRANGWSLDQLPDTSELMRQGAIERGMFLRRAVRLEVVTVGWNVIEGIVAVSAGTLASSIALVAFGIDSFVETASAGVVGWRLRAEIRGHADEERAEALERRAGRIAGGLLLGLAFYIMFDAGRRLLGFGSEAQESPIGIVLTAISVVVMPVLGWVKLRTASALQSGALRADAYETIACSWLSLTTLIGLILNASFGLWWADPLAALAIVPLVVREGLEGWRGEQQQDSA